MDKRELSIETVTVVDATALLEMNKRNRPISQSHVARIVTQIKAGKWRFNGDTIKIGENGDVLDGQHRLWAVIYAETPIETIVVRGIAEDAFATVDSIRKLRLGADILALKGYERFRKEYASALSWLFRWERKALLTYRAPSNRVENSDIEMMAERHPGLMALVERCAEVRSLISPGLLAFLMHILGPRDRELSERLLETLADPAGVPVGDGYYEFRRWLIYTKEKNRVRDPIVIIAMAIKAWNAKRRNIKLTGSGYHWRPGVDAFPDIL